MRHNGRHELFLRFRSRADGAWLTSPDLRPRLIAEARETGSNMTAVIVRVLAAHYGMNVEPASSRGTEPSPDAPFSSVYLPIELAQRIKTSLALGESMQDRAFRILCAHFDLPPGRPAEAAVA